MSIAEDELHQPLSDAAIVERIVSAVMEQKLAAGDCRVLPCPCPRCGGRLIIIETFEPGMQPISWPQPTPIRIDTS